MHAKKLLLYVLLFFLLPVSGAAPIRKPIPRYVTAAQLDFSHGREKTSLHFQAPEKLSSLLNCLRLAAPYGRCQKPQVQNTAHSYRVTLSFSDLTQQCYRIEDYRYISQDGEIWQKIQPEGAYYLYLLLRLLPPDPIEK